VTRPLFIVADAFSKSATAKIEAAGGTAHVLEFPTADGHGESDEEPLRSLQPLRRRHPKKASGHDFRDPPPDELG
jgi:hypothetical protein